MLTSKLACGPMSREIIEAVFSYSHKYGKQLMLICSRNQVDKYSGYVFTTEQYMDYIDQMRQRYSQANVVICRDHCGPGFGPIVEHDLDATKSTIQHDIECGFDLIHIDLCHAKMSHKEKLRNTIELMQFARYIRSDIMFEIGTDENVGVAETDVARIIADIKACRTVADPTFYVVQTGSLVRQAHNIGSFDHMKVDTMCQVLHRCGTKLKEHNADYLTAEQISARRGIVDAVNIAPQLGVIQTSYVLCQALIYGVDTQLFENTVMRCGKWSKWGCNPANIQLCALVAGHYHFTGWAYKQIVANLAKHVCIRENIILEIGKVIEYYLLAME